VLEERKGPPGSFLKMSKRDRTGEGKEDPSTAIDPSNAVLFEERANLGLGSQGIRGMRIGKFPCPSTKETVPDEE